MHLHFQRSEKRWLGNKEVFAEEKYRDYATCVWINEKNREKMQAVNRGSTGIMVFNVDTLIKGENKSRIMCVKT